MDGVLEVEGSADIGVEEVVVLGREVVREDDVNVDDWVVVGAVVVERVVGWTEVSGVDVEEWLPLLEAAVIADGAEEDIDEALAEVGETVDDGTDGLADVGAVVEAIVVAPIVVCEALRVVHEEGPQKMSVNARRWVLRLCRKCRRCYRRSW